MFVTIVSAVDYADTELSNFGGAPESVTRPMELAPTIGILAFSADTVAAVSLRIFFAPAVGSAAEDQIEVFNQAVGIGPIAVGRYVSILGGQGGCMRAFRPGNTTPMTLRATSTGLAGVDSQIRFEWNWAGAVT